MLSKNCIYLPFRSAHTVFSPVGLGVLVQGHPALRKELKLLLIADGLLGYGQECPLIQVLLHLVVVDGQNVNLDSGQFLSRSSRSIRRLSAIRGFLDRLNLCIVQMRIYVG